MSSLASSYTGNEPSLVWSARKPVSAGLFDVRPPVVPYNAKSIYDDDLDCIIGYQFDVAGDSDRRHILTAERPLGSSQAARLADSGATPAERALPPQTSLK